MFRSKMTRVTHSQKRLKNSRKGRRRRINKKKKGILLCFVHKTKYTARHWFLTRAHKHTLSAARIALKCARIKTIYGLVCGNVCCPHQVCTLHAQIADGWPTEKFTQYEHLKITEILLMPRKIYDLNSFNNYLKCFLILASLCRDLALPPFFYLSLSLSLLL